MAEIIRERQLEHGEEWGLEFVWLDDPSAGFSFPCTPDGSPLRDQLQPAGLENLEKCLSGEHDVLAEGVRHHTWSQWLPAVLLCDCGHELLLESAWLNPCDCGLDYDGAGHRLAPRSQWAEETGETLADILSPHDPEDIGGW